MMMLSSKTRGLWLCPHVDSPESPLPSNGNCELQNQAENPKEVVEGGPEADQGHKNGGEPQSASSESNGSDSDEKEMSHQSSAASSSSDQDNEGDGKGQEHEFTTWEERVLEVPFSGAEPECLAMQFSSGTEVSALAFADKAPN